MYSMYLRSILLAVVLSATMLPSLQAQTVLVDSLRRTLARHDLSPQDRILYLDLLARSQCLTDAAGGMNIAHDALQQCWKIKDASATAFTYTIISMLHHYNGGDRVAAYTALDSGFYYARKSGDRQALGIAWYRKAWLQNIEANLQDAVSSSLEALKALEGTDSPGTESVVYYILAQVHANWKDLSQQGTYATLCLEAARKSGDYDFIAGGHQVVAHYNYLLYQKNNTQHALLDTALANYLAGIRIFQKHGGETIFKHTYAILALNVAVAYRKYNIGSHPRDSVNRYVDMALKVALETRQSAVISACYGIMSDHEIEKGNYKKAETLLLSGLAALQADSVENRRIKTKVLEALSQVSEQQGDHQKALKYYHDYHVIYEEIFDAEKVSIAKRLEAQYQSEKDKEALASLTHTNTLNERLKHVYIALSMALSLIALLFVWSLRSRLKITVQEKKILEVEKEDAALQAQLKLQENRQLALEKQEAELQARLKEEESLRLQAEQKLMLERQGRLQKDLLAGSLQIVQKDELLQTVQKKIGASAKDQTIVRQINNIIDQNKKTDEAFAASRADFDSVRPEFFEQLRQKSNDTLSRLDLKHCAYISIGLTNKEIAQRLAVAPKSILMSRYRIKLKLGLTKEEDLDEFISKLG
jgi:DNA-binding CsgD family transcriptional regulator